MTSKSEEIRTTTSVGDQESPMNGGKKRTLSQMNFGKDEVERQRLRDKNRTNSKRFRDRKKNYMDGLFEEKYRLGKENNELKETQEKLKAMLREAQRENELHRTRQSAYLDVLGGGLDFHTDTRHLLPAAGSLAATDLKPAALSRQLPPAVPTTQIEDYVALSRAAAPASSYLPPYLGLLGEVQRERNIFNTLALQGLGLGSKQVVGDAPTSLQNVI